MTSPIIDFHQHMSPQLPVTTLIKIMDKLQIEKTVIMPYPIGNYDWIELVGMKPKPNDYVQTILKHMENRN